jgi:hypothetical protein
VWEKKRVGEREKMWARERRCGLVSCVFYMTDPVFFSSAWATNLLDVRLQLGIRETVLETFPKCRNGIRATNEAGKVGVYGE